MILQAQSASEDREDLIKVRRQRQLAIAPEALAPLDQQVRQPKLHFGVAGAERHSAFHVAHRLGADALSMQRASHAVVGACEHGAGENLALEVEEQNAPVGLVGRLVVAQQDLVLPLRRVDGREGLVCARPARVRVDGVLRAPAHKTSATLRYMLV
jgi:hypothetical protein